MVQRKLNERKRYRSLVTTPAAPQSKPDAGYGEEL